jgi:hypothetical protein
MIGEMTSLKQELHRDDVKSSWLHENEDSFCHSFPHFMHFTRNLFISHTTRAVSVQRETPARLFFGHEAVLLQDFLSKIKHFFHSSKQWPLFFLCAHLDPSFTQFKT